MNESSELRLMTVIEQMQSLMFRLAQRCVDLETRIDNLENKNNGTTN